VGWDNLAEESSLLLQKRHSLVGAALRHRNALSIQGEGGEVGEPVSVVAAESRSVAGLYETAQAFNACMYRIIHLQPQFVGAIGLCEEIDVEAYKMLQKGSSAITGSSRSTPRPLSVHYEADKEHGEGGHRMIDRFVTGTGREDRVPRGGASARDISSRRVLIQR
jgi:hypothetical protein